MKTWIQRQKDNVTKSELRKHIKVLADEGITYKPYIPSKEESRLNASYLRNYGISYDDYHIILEEQGRVCAICKKSSSGKRLSVDHCHKTMVIRGLLCHNCNIGLGLFKDSPEIMIRAIRYLNEVVQNDTTLDDICQEE